MKRSLTHSSTQILWLQHASEFTLFLSLAEEFKKHGFESVFVNKTEPVHEAYQKNDFESHYVLSLIQNTTPLPEAELIRLDKLYGPPFIRSIAHSDVVLRFLHKHAALQDSLVGRMYTFWEAFFDTHTIQYIFTRETATFLTRTAYAVAKKRGIPFFIIGFGPIPDTFVLSDEGEQYMWSGLSAHLRESSQQLDGMQKKQVEEVILSHIPDITHKMSIRHHSFQFLKTVRRYLGTFLHERTHIRVTNPLKRATMKYARFRMRKKIMWHLLTQVFFKYDTPDTSERFIYFPLFTGLEATYLVHTPFWAKHQAELIEHIADSLPHGVHLYVKEHPHNPGDLTFWELKRLQKKDAVRILPPDVSSQLLIEKSEMVVTIQGTVGWEALISKNPVLSLGNVSFYSYSSCVYHLENINDLKDTLHAILREGKNVYSEQERDWWWFLYGVSQTVLNGRVLNTRPPYGFPSDVANAECVVSEIFEILKKIEKN